MAEATKKMHYAWLIFIGCCCVSAGSMAATISIVGVYMLPVSTALKVGPGDWMLWLSLCSICSVITTPFWGRFMQTKNINVVTSVSAILLVLAIFMFSFGNNVYWFYIWGAILGCGVPAVCSLLVPTLIGNWFDKKNRGKFLGIAAAFTGVGVFVWAPMFTKILQTFGWSTAYMVNAALIAVLLLPWTLFIFKFKPADKGLEPYGYDPNADNSDAGILSQGISHTKALKTAPFWILLVVILITSMGMGFNSNQVGIAKEMMTGVMDPKAAAMLGASMISIAAVGNICGKILFGAMVDRFGMKPTFAIFIIMLLAGYALWLFSPSQTTLLVGAFLFGTHNALVSVGYPLLVRNLFGHKDYAKIFSYLMMANALMGGFSATIISYVYQNLGSYASALTVALVLVVIFGILIFATISFIGKISWDKDASKESKEATVPASN